MNFKDLKHKIPNYEFKRKKKHSHKETFYLSEIPSGTIEEIIETLQRAYKENLQRLEDKEYLTDFFDICGYEFEYQWYGYTAVDYVIVFLMEEKDSVYQARQKAVAEALELEKEEQAQKSRDDKERKRKRLLEEIAEKKAELAKLEEE